MVGYLFVTIGLLMNIRSSLDYLQGPLVGVRYIAHQSFLTEFLVLLEHLSLCQFLVSVLLLVSLLGNHFPSLRQEET